MSNFDSVSYVMNHIDELREQVPASIKAKYPNAFIAIPDDSDLKTIDGSRLVVVVNPNTSASLAEYVLCDDWSLRRRENAPKLDKDHAGAVVYMASLRIETERPKSLVHLAASIPSHPFSNL